MALFSRLRSDELEKMQLWEGGLAHTTHLLRCYRHPGWATALGRKGFREQAWDAQTLHIPKKGLSPQLVFLETPGQLLGAEI